MEQHPEIINARPSKSTIQRILKENNLKPHQSRYFLHITDPDFFPKMNHLIELYLNPPQNLFFFDECPGIQILKRLTPDIRTDETAKMLEEFEYIRNGTMNVLAFFNYADGKVYADCKADHKTDTFLEIFQNMRRDIFSFIFCIYCQQPDFTIRLPCHLTAQRIFRSQPLPGIIFPWSDLTARVPFKNGYVIT